MATKKRKKSVRPPPEPEDNLESEGEDTDDVDASDDLDRLDDADLDPSEADDSIESTVEVIDDRVLAARSSQTGLARLDPLQAYMREVQQHPLLTAEEEKQLAVDYEKTGNVQAAAKLVTSNLRLVVKLAYEYRRAYRNMMDLIQEGNIGLMQAVKRYDPYRGVKLSSYAAWWIRAYMLRYILNNHRMVKIGTTQAQRKLFFNLAKEKARLTAMGIEPTHDEIAKSLNVEERDVVEMDRRLARGDASLDTPVSEADGRSTTRIDLLPSASIGPEGATETAELSMLVREKLEEFRETLAGKDITIFDKRLVAEDPVTLQQLGDEFGVSRERVRQLEARLRNRVGVFLKEALGDAVEVM